MSSGCGRKTCWIAVSLGSRRVRSNCQIQRDRLERAVRAHHGERARYCHSANRPRTRAALPGERWRPRSASASGRPAAQPSAPPGRPRHRRPAASSAQGQSRPRPRRAVSDITRPRLRRDGGQPPAGPRAGEYRASASAPARCDLAPPRGGCSTIRLMRLPDRPGTGPDLPGAQRGRPDDALGRPDADGAAAAGAERASLRFRELADRLARLSEAHPSARDDSVAAAGAHGGQVSGGSVSGGSVSGGEAWWRGELPAAPPDSGPRAGQAAAGEEPGGSGSGAAAQAEIPGAVRAGRPRDC